MRTTLDLDETVLAVARAKARADGISLGAAVSALALAGLVRDRAGAAPGGFPVLSGRPDHVITDELVEAFRDDV